MPCRFYTLRSVTKLAEEYSAGMPPIGEGNEAGLDAEEARRQTGARAEAPQKVNILSVCHHFLQDFPLFPHTEGVDIQRFACHALRVGRAVLQVAASDLARSAYDLLANVQADVEVDPQHSWCGLDAAAAKGGAESSQKRRKRKRLEVIPLQSPLLHKGVLSAEAVWQALWSA